eukprot:NODE_301_length_2114_cov_4.174635_g295_i0.p3 GENE.NODE_301_length_2114_cov_4.174635_g295_i0~~NODE_301_length_2114_cov_4.174635_g295_i0.p3  ORF type:complete len:109 (-),score=0.45 NODE_301_length_2114_cov_4.174635_g295_i0:1602-1928(-)
MRSSGKHPTQQSNTGCSGPVLTTGFVASPFRYDNQRHASDISNEDKRDIHGQQPQTAHHARYAPGAHQYGYGCVHPPPPSSLAGQQLNSIAVPTHVAAVRTRQLRRGN